MVKNKITRSIVKYQIEIKIYTTPIITVPHGKECDL